MSTKSVERSRRQRAEAAAAQRRRAARIRLAMFWGAVLAVIAGVVAVMMLTSRPESSAVVREAPGFTLTATDGSTTSLSDYRGHNVLLYFSEGAGCQACLVQMGEIEKRADAFGRLDTTVLPIVMNSRDQIVRDMADNGVRTPFLLDDGTVSRAYGTLGKGMHADLPGHSFVLIDASGRQRWYGEYPSMWLAPDDLLDEVRQHLG